MKPFITIRRSKTEQRECLPLRGMTDSLLQAYDCVARRAYQKFVSRGAHPGGELDDWLNAERELLGNLPVNLEDGGESLSALASLPGFSRQEVDVGIDPRWLVIFGHHHATDQSGHREELDADFDQVAAWVSTIHRDARTLRISSRGARSPGSSSMRRAPPSLPPRLIASTEHAAAVFGVVGAARELDSSESQSAAGSDGEGLPLERLGSSAGCRESSAENGRGQEQGHIAPQLFCVLELPAEIDPSRCVAILANGLLGIRMPKRKSPAH